MTRWTDAKKWDINWDSLENLESGKQASAKKVARRDTGEMAFLKILNRQDEDERRSRFFREASAYETFEHPNIPRFIESNAHLHADKTMKVYLAMELVAGSSLGSAVARKRPSFEEAVALTLRLLDVAAHFHQQGWVHRDIKPDNIMIRGDDFLDPVLVDFGVSYKDAVTPSFATEVDQELGNRFFRLPELAADSVAKQDSRSDLAFIAGILFYCLTGVSPQQPLNNEFKMPHQRPAELALLREAAQNVVMPLLAFFDRALSHTLAGRFETAGEMSTKLNDLLDAFHNGAGVNEPIDLESLRERANSTAAVEYGRLKLVYTAAMFTITSVHAKVLASVAPTYTSHHESYTDFSKGMEANLGFSHFAASQLIWAPHFLVALVGDEIAVKMGDDVIYRTDANNPNFDHETFRAELERRFIVGLSRLIDSEPRPGSSIVVPVQR